MKMDLNYFQFRREINLNVQLGQLNMKDNLLEIPILVDATPKRVTACQLKPRVFVHLPTLLMLWPQMGDCNCRFNTRRTSY